MRLAPSSWFVPDKEGRCFVCVCTERAAEALLAAQALSALLLLCLAPALAASAPGHSICVDTGSAYDTATACVESCSSFERCVYYGRDVRNAVWAVSAAAAGGLASAAALALLRWSGRGGQAPARERSLRTAAAALGSVSCGVVCFSFWYLLGSLATLETGSAFDLTAATVAFCVTFVASSAGAAHVSLLPRRGPGEPL